MVLIAALALPSIALAATPVTLKAQPASHGASVTLGDLFDGLDGSAAGVVIAHAAQPGLDAVLDAEVVQALVHRAGYDWPNASGYRRIIVNAEAGDARPVEGAHARAKTTARHGRASQALTYARNIMSGDVLSADDLVWSDEAVAPQDGVSDPDAAIGKAARHALRAGAPAAARDLVSPKVIHRDDGVAVVFEADGVSVTLQAKALADCGVGDTLEVINPQSKKVIETVCSGPGQALVGPRAEDLKAANTPSGGQGRLAVASLR